MASTARKELRTPQDCDGRFPMEVFERCRFPMEVFERCRRSERAVAAAPAELCV